VSHPLLVAPIGHSLLRLAGPTTAFMVVQIAVVLAAIWLVGRLGSGALAAFALVYPFVVMVMNVSSGGLGGAVAASMARALGGEATPAARGSTLGGPGDGMAAELVVLDEDGLLPIPEHLSFEQAATLPCAGVTAWNAVVVQGQVKPGDTVQVAVRDIAGHAQLMVMVRLPEREFNAQPTHRIVDFLRGWFEGAQHG